MSAKSKRWAVNQLDQALRPYKDAGESAPPKKGWIRAVRTALGMSAKQLGARVGMSQAAVSQIEASEAAGKASLSTLRKMAGAMDCTLVYGLAPTLSLENTLRSRATTIAKRRLQKTAHSMSLENQAVPDMQTQKQMEIFVDDLLVNRYAWFWEKNVP